MRSNNCYKRGIFQRELLTFLGQLDDIAGFGGRALAHAIHGTNPELVDGGGLEVLEQNPTLIRRDIAQFGDPVEQRVWNWTYEFFCDVNVLEKTAGGVGVIGER